MAIRWEQIWLSRDQELLICITVQFKCMEEEDASLELSEDSTGGEHTKTGDSL